MPSDRDFAADEERRRQDGGQNRKSDVHERPLAPTTESPGADDGR